MITQPATCRLPAVPVSIQRSTVTSASSDSPNSRGSVIGVLCRYSTFGLSRISAGPTRPAATEPVRLTTYQAKAASPTLSDSTEIRTAG